MRISRSYLPRLVQLMARYGLYALNTPTLGLRGYEDVAPLFTLSDLMVVWLLHLLAGALVALLTMALSQRQAGALRTMRP